MRIAVDSIRRMGLQTRRALLGPVPARLDSGLIVYFVMAAIAASAMPHF